jgi:predicted dehydrogenase
MLAKAGRPLKIVLAGAGSFGREHLTRLLARSDVTVAGIADPSASARDLINERYPNLRVASEVPLLLKDEKPDGIIVATSAQSHFEITRSALVRGIPVLLEKPVTPTASEAVQLVALAQEHKTFILPGHILRFSMDHRAVADVVASGVIGKVLYLNSRRYRDADHAIRYMDDPVLTTLIHDIDLAVWLTGQEFATARCHRTGGPGFRSITTVDLETTSGVLCHLRTTWTFDSGILPPDLVEVVCENGSVELEVGVARRKYLKGECITDALIVDDDPLNNEHQCFLDHINQNTSPNIITMAEAIRGLRTSDAILNALKTKGEVKFTS